MPDRNAVFANFVCRFGNDKFLLDYLKEIVLPAFMDDSLIRGYGELEYFFYDQEIVTLQARPFAVIAVAGRFIKKTKLSRDQVFDDAKGLVEDHQELDTAPSSFFVLVLNNHKLYFFPETPDAPTLKALEATAAAFLREHRQKYIRLQQREAKERGEKLRIRELETLHPKPVVDVVPLSTEETIEEFLEQFTTIKRLELKLIRPNPDLAGMELFQAIQERAAEMNSERTKLMHQNRDGLDAEKVKQEIADADVTGGNAAATLDGVNNLGNRITGDNEHFTIKIPLADLTGDTSTKAKKLHTIYLGNVAKKMPDAPSVIPQEDNRVVGVANKAKP